MVNEDITQDWELGIDWSHFAIVGFEGGAESLKGGGRS